MPTQVDQYFPCYETQIHEVCQLDQSKHIQYHPQSQSMFSPFPEWDFTKHEIKQKWSKDTLSNANIYDKTSSMSCTSTLCQTFH